MRHQSEKACLWSRVEELRANPRLTRRFVQDLNRSPTLPLEDDSCDAALCCAGVQYLQRPVEVFAEVARVLRPGALLIVSFSNRCFPTKADAIWRALDARGHASLIHLYLEHAGFVDIHAHVLRDGATSDPLITVTGAHPEPKSSPDVKFTETAMCEELLMRAFLSLALACGLASAARAEPTLSNIAIIPIHNGVNKIDRFARADFAQVASYPALAM